MGRQDDTEKKIENWLGGGREEFKLRKDRRREGREKKRNILRRES